MKHLVFIGLMILSFSSIVLAKHEKVMSEREFVAGQYNAMFNASTETQVSYFKVNDLEEDVSLAYDSNIGLIGVTVSLMDFDSKDFLKLGSSKYANDSLSLGKGSDITGKTVLLVATVYNLPVDSRESNLNVTLSSGASSRTIELKKTLEGNSAVVYTLLVNLL